MTKHSLSLGGSPCATAAISLLSFPNACTCSGIARRRSRVGNPVLNLSFRTNVRNLLLYFIPPLEKGLSGVALRSRRDTGGFADRVRGQSKQHHRSSTVVTSIPRRASGAHSIRICYAGNHATCADRVRGQIKNRILYV